MTTISFTPITDSEKARLIDWLNRPECGLFLQQLDTLETYALNKFMTQFFDQELPDLYAVQREVSEIRKARMVIEEMLNGTFEFRKTQTI